MSIVGSNTLAGASGQAGGAAPSGFQIDRSLRIDDVSNATLTRTPSTAGNRKTWTLSFWIKRTEIGGNHLLFNAGNTSNGDHSVMRFNGDMFQMYQYGHGGDTTAWSGGNGSQLRTSAKFRDPSAWMHIVVAMDTTQATQSDRLKYYINGVLQTEFDSTNYPVQNSNPGYWNSTYLHCWGGQVQNTTPSGSSDFMLAEVNLIDGQALAATDFGEYDDNNNWNPKDTSGLTFGTNGFRLSFSDNSSNAALGTDSSGNSNTWTVNNISAAGLEWASTTWSNDISIDSGNYYLSGNTGPNGFDGNSATYIDCRLGTGANNTTNIIWEPTGGISGVTKIRVNSNYADDYRINNGTWTSFSSGGSYTQIYSGSAFTLTKLEIRRTSNSGSDYGHRVTAYELNDLEVLDDTAQAANDPGIDSLIDTPTNYTASSANNGGNYATWNPLRNAATLTNGNLDISGPSNGVNSFATVGLTSGKWYWEVTIGSVQNTFYPGIGVNTDLSLATTSQSGEDAAGYMYLANGTKFRSNVASAYGASFTSNDVIGVALDMDAGTITFYKNGSTQGQAFSGILGTAVPVVISYTNSTCFANFGQRPFAYTPPTGFLSLCTTNLPDPTIADGSTAFDVALWTGNGSSAQTISTPNLSPDMVWYKERSSTSSHAIVDAVRGATNAAKVIYPDRSDAEATANSTQSITSLNSDGFTIGSSDNSINQSSQTYVGWAWDAGTSTVSNTDGSITSSVRANPSAGFSIVTWYRSGGSNTATIGHGLNAVPELIILKDRDSASNWYVGSPHLGGSPWLRYLTLNGTGSWIQNSDVFQQGGQPTSSVFGVGVVGNTNLKNHLAYCFAPVEGYSAFGSYTGNGSADGPFVFTGHLPRFVIIKRTDASGNDWQLYDTERSTFNEMDDKLKANSSDAEVVEHPIDFLSNGFKPRNTANGSNGSGATYIYASFASSPFQTARAR